MLMTTTLLSQYYKKYNQEYFNNLLPSYCRFGLLTGREGRKYLGIYNSDQDDNFNVLDQEILMSNEYDWEEEQIRDVLLHEMIHEYLIIHKIDSDGTHGSHFTRMMNMFNKRFGTNISIVYDLDNFKRIKKKNWWS